MLKQTPLAEAHRALGAKMVPFAGWEMPIQYPTGIIAEVQAVRNGVGVFDVSHMGEFEVTGPDRNAFVNRITTNDVAALAPGQVQYSALLTREGTFLDDCTVYRFEDRLMLVVNASNREKAWEHSVDQKTKATANVRLKDISDDTGLLAVQGPKAQALLQPIAQLDLEKIAYYHCGQGVVGGVQCFVSRTGYTGEDGFEIFVAPEHADELWSGLLERGAEDGLMPAGLGARDTLRLEAGMALYGHEIDDSTTPFDAGLDWTVKLDKGDFLGRAALVAQREGGGPARRLVGFEVVGRGIAREGAAVFAAGGSEPVGKVTSGTWSPTFEKALGMAYAPPGLAAPGGEVALEVRGRELAAEVVALPFYRRPR